MLENKKTIIVSTLLAIVLLVGAFFLGSWNERRILAELVKNSSQQNQSQQTVPQSPSDEKIAKAIESGKIQDCESIASQEKKTQCKNAVISKQATEKKDPSICNQMPNKEDATQCSDTIAFSNAAEGNISSCDAISDASAKSSCVFNAWNSKATKAKDASICNNIAEQDNKDLCKENVANAE